MILSRCCAHGGEILYDECEILYHLHASRKSIHNKIKMMQQQPNTIQASLPKAEDILAGYLTIRNIDHNIAIETISPIERK